MASESTASFGPGSHSGAAGQELRVLVIDENPRDRDSIVEALRTGLPAARATTLEDRGELPAILNRADFDVVVADHRPGWVDAFEVLGQVRASDHPDVPVILCTGGGSEELAV